MAAEVPVFIRIRGKKDSSVNAVLGQTKSEVGRLTAHVVDSGTKIATVFGGASVGILAMGIAAVRSAGQFEQLAAKLNALLKDGERSQAQLAQAAALAASTPFSVEGIVTAAVQLTAYGLQANKVLKQVADLAAAMGTSVEDASKSVGKAASGSAEGFQSLRDTYAITTAELKKFGAVLSDQGGILLKTPQQVEKAREALLKLIEVKFGGSATAQSATFQGAMSNLGDSAQLAAVKVGESLIPVATTLARFAGDLLGTFQKVPQGVIATGVALTAFTGIGLGAAAALTLLATKAVGWYTALQVASQTSTAAAAVLARLDGAYAAVAKRATEAATAQTAFASSARVAVGGLGIATAVYVVATVAIRAYEKAAIATGEAIDLQAKKLTSATNDWRLYRDAINGAAKESGIFIARGESIGETFSKLQKTLGDGNLSSFVAGLEKAGLNLEDARKTAADTAEKLGPAIEQYRELLNVIKTIKDAGQTDAPLYTFGGKVPDASAISAEQQKFLKGLYPGRNDTLDLGDLQSKAKELNLIREELNNTVNAANTAAKAFEGFSVPLQEAVDHAKSLDNFLQFSKSSRDLQTLQTRLKVTGDEVKRFQDLASKQGLPVDAAGLQKDLLTASGTRLEFVKSFLGVLGQQASAETDLAAVTQAAEEAKLTAIERTQAQTRALRQTSLADEKAFAAERLAVVEGSMARERELISELAAMKAKQTAFSELDGKDKALLGGQPAFAGLDAKIRATEAELEAVRKMADEEMKARTDVRDVAKKLNEDKANNAKKSLQSQADAARSLLDDLRQGEGGSASSVSAELTQILAGLDRWEGKNKAILSGSRDIRRQFEQTREDIESQKAQILERAQSGRLDEIKQKVSLELTDSQDIQGKLTAIRGAIVQINAEGLKSKAAQAELNNLKRQEVDLTREALALEKSKAAVMAGLTQTSLEQEIEHLKTRQANGENVANILIAKEKELLAAKLDAINAAADADLAAGKDREVVERERSLKIRGLTYEEYAKKVELNKRANDEIDAENNRRSGKKDAQTGTGLGNPGSISKDAYSTGIGSSTLGAKGGRAIIRRPHVFLPTPEQIGKTIGIDVNAKAPGAAGGPATAGKDQSGKAPAQTINDSRTFSAQINMEGGSIVSMVADPRFKAAVIAAVEGKFKNEGYRIGNEGAWP